MRNTSVNASNHIFVQSALSYWKNTLFTA